MHLSPPPLDANGNVIPHDHPDIQVTDFVIRRIPDNWIHFDPKINGNRISSLAFKPSSGANGGMSIDLKSQIECDNIDPIQFVTTPRFIGSILMCVEAIRNMQLRVGFDPIIPDNPYHGQAWGVFNKNTERLMRHSSQWYVEIPNVSISIE